MRRLALALALIAFAFAPAMAQGADRTHRGGDRATAREVPPPAPTPGSQDQRTVRPPPAPTPGDRDHRTTHDRSMTPGQPVQWALQGAARIDPNVRYAIYNLRRVQQGKEAQPAFHDCGSGSVCSDTTDWNPNGGMFEFRRAPSPNDKGSITVNEYVAIYNTKTERYLYWSGTWKDEPQYFWQLRGLKVDAATATVTFSLYQPQANAYLVLREQGVDIKHQNCCGDLVLTRGPGRID